MVILGIQLKVAEKIELKTKLIQKAREDNNADGRLIVGLKGRGSQYQKGTIDILYYLFRDKYTYKMLCKVLTFKVVK